jgi:cytoskeletal protein RodZ
VGEKILAAFRADAATSAFQQAVRDPQVLAEPANVSVIEALRTSGTLPAGSLDDTSFLSQLDPRIARPFLEGFAGSMSLVFTVAAGILVLAFVVVLFLPEEPLRSVSGIQAREQEAAETAAAAASVSAPSSQMVDGDTLDESAQARR